MKILRTRTKPPSQVASLEGVDLSFTGKEVKALCYDLELFINHFGSSMTTIDLKGTLQKLLTEHNHEVI